MMFTDLIEPETDASPEAARTARSRAWFERARQVLAGGISSSARVTTTGALDHPLYLVQGKGAHVHDADGNEYIDYLIAYGSAILGHAPPHLVAPLQQVLTQGTMFGTCNTAEVELAEQICRMVPCAELVRYANSGSEAIQGAVRAARGVTGRHKILKFEGHYHGWVDVLAMSNRPGADEVGPYETPHTRAHSPGIPPGVVADVVICPWNDIDVLRSLLDRHRDEVAAVICEPIVANNACTMPQPGYLEALREECTRRGVLLIFDEICTGFRVAPGGAQELFGVTPDLAVYSKALGGGLPIAAFAGRRDIMSAIGSNRIKHGGTYNGSPLCATAAYLTLTELARPQTQQQLRDSGRRLKEAIARAARDHRVRCAIQGVDAMFQVAFSVDGSPTRQYRDTFRLDLKRYDAFRDGVLRRGIHVNAAPLACWFVSSALTEDDTARTCEAIGEVFAELR